jgi:hypothetical protein
VGLAKQFHDPTTSAAFSLHAVQAPQPPIPSHIDCCPHTPTNVVTSTVPSDPKLEARHPQLQARGGMRAMGTLSMNTLFACCCCCCWQSIAVDVGSLLLLMLLLLLLLLLWCCHSPLCPHYLALSPCYSPWCHPGHNARDSNSPLKDRLAHLPAPHPYTTEPIGICANACVLL